MRRRAVLAAAFCLMASQVTAGGRVLSLDQCADQYVLALSPRADIVGLSTRATRSDSYLRDRARGLPLRRASEESILAARPDIVVRYWGGDERLLTRLGDRGVTVVRIDDATDFPGIRVNVRRVARALKQRAAGEVLIAGMDRQLAANRGAWRGERAFYLTSGGDTAGPGTLVDSMMREAGLTNIETSPGFRSVSLEQLVLHPPGAIVGGFFDADSSASQSWGIGRHQVVRSLLENHGLVRLPASLLGCPAWFAGDGVAAIVAARGRPNAGG